MATRKSIVLSVFFTLVGLPASAGAAGGYTSNRPVLVAGGGSTRAGYLHADAHGAEWALPGGSKLNASPGSEIHVLSTPQPLVLAGGRHVSGFTVIVRTGRVDVSVPERSSSAVVLAMPRQASAIVQSGRLRASATGGKVAIANVQGTTTVAVGGGAFRPLAPGMMLEPGASSERAMIAAPTGLQGARVWFNGLGNQSQQFSWNPVTGASAYRLDIKNAKDGTLVERIETGGTNASPAVAGIAPGGYELELYAVDGLGIESAQPLSVPLRMVGTELPEGAYIDTKGQVRLGKGQRVSFSETSGLEMTYGTAGKYIKASNHVGLYRNEPTLVHFRFPGGFEGASVRLLPRTVMANVEVGPKTVTWPETPVEIRIRLQDPSGEPIPGWMEATPRVLLGIRPLDVTFRHAHGEWIAKVPARAGGGPWVMRVEVTDQFGIPLGRDFVEIVRGPSKPKLKTVAAPKRGGELSSR